MSFVELSLCRWPYGVDGSFFGSVLAMNDPAQTAVVTGGLTQPWATLIAGTAVLVSAIIGALVAWYSRVQSEKHFERKHQLEVNQGLRSRYTAGAEQLGHESPAIRLAGVYAVSSLADDWYAQKNGDERQVCIDLLRAYLRTPQSVLNHSDPLTAGEREVRRTIVNVIAQRRAIAADDPRSWVGSECSLGSADLAGVSLSRLNLVGMDFSQSNLRSAVLDGCDLSNACLDDSDLSNTSLRGTRADGAHFRDSNLTEADCTNSDMNGAMFIATNMTGIRLTAAALVGATILACDLKRAQLDRTHLTDAEITESDLEETRMEGAFLGGASISHCVANRLDLRGARLAGAKFEDVNLVDAEMEGANYDRTTAWPENFMPLLSAPLSTRCGH